MTNHYRIKKKIIKTVNKSLIPRNTSQPAETYSFGLTKMEGIREMFRKVSA